MEARKLIAGASFGPDALKVLFQAYDQAWDMLAPRQCNETSAIEGARLRLATIMLGLMREDLRDAAWLRDESVRHYRAAGRKR